MGVIGVLLAVLVLGSLVTLLSFAVAGVAVSVMTVTRARRERRLSDELDRVLVDIVGPRSRELATNE